MLGGSFFFYCVPPRHHRRRRSWPVHRWSSVVTLHRTLVLGRSAGAVTGEFATPKLPYAVIPVITGVIDHAFI